MKNIAMMFLFIFLFFACERSSPVDDIDRIKGDYKAIVFEEPGQLDGGVDILANGGSLTARLFQNFYVEGYILIPEDIGSNYAPIDTTYMGTFILAGDSIQFKNTSTPLDHLSPFFINGSLLVSKDRRGRGPGFMILEKQ
jgi:hypothetical protein